MGLCSSVGLPNVDAMTQKATSKKVAARDRVREIRALVDVEKPERDRRLYEVVIAFHEARFERDEAWPQPAVMKRRWPRLGSCWRWTSRSSGRRRCAI